MTITRKPPWILASASPRRREILEGLGLTFRVDPSRAPEPAWNDGEEPVRYAVRAAKAKSLETVRRHSRGVVVGADTIVVCRKEILGKPDSMDDAARMLRLLSGGWHEVITGMCLTDASSRKAVTSSSTSRVHFRRLASGEIDWYLATGEYRDKAGAYAIQGYASLFIDRIEGCYFNVVGFPIATFERLCRRLGVPLIPGRRSRRAR